jgi:hypothetical protein
MVEEWKQISYAPNYEISNLANVKNITTNKLLNLNYERVKKTNTRMRAGLSQNGKNKHYYLHRIIAEHFLENPNNLPEVNHIDGDCYNNKCSNLEWISKNDNMKHARLNNLVTNYKRKVLIKNKETNEEKIINSLTECAVYLNTSPGNIVNYIKNISNNEEKGKSKKSKQVIQYDENNQILKTFNSIGEAQKTLNCNYISMCCNYYEYDDLTRPKSYKQFKKIKGFIYKFAEISPNTISFNNFEISYLNDNDNKIKTETNNKDIIWKEYPYLKKYMISNTGEVKHKRTERILMGSKVNGYRYVLLNNDDNKKMNRLIHRLVAETFLENPENKPVVNHKDTNILNNCVDNLEWVTYKENMNTKETIQNLKKGKRENSKNILQINIENGEIIGKFNSAMEAEEKTKIDNSTIYIICNYYKGNKGYIQKTYQKKYIFIYEEDRDKLDEYLKIAKLDYTKKVFQYNKNTNELIQTFNSGCEAARKLNIKNGGINQCCQYYNYTDDTRPKCYKLKSFKGFIFKQHR